MSSLVFKLTINSPLCQTCITQVTPLKKILLLRHSFVFLLKLASLHPLVLKELYLRIKIGQWTSRCNIIIIRVFSSVFSISDSILVHTASNRHRFSKFNEFILFILCVGHVPRKRSTIISILYAWNCFPYNDLLPWHLWLKDIIPSCRKLYYFGAKFAAVIRKPSWFKYRKFKSW